MRHFGDVDLMIVNGFTRTGIFLTLLFRLTSLIAVFQLQFGVEIKAIDGTNLTEIINRCVI